MEKIPKTAKNTAFGIFCCFVLVTSVLDFYDVSKYTSLRLKISLLSHPDHHRQFGQE